MLVNRFAYESERPSEARLLIAKVLWNVARKLRALVRFGHRAKAASSGNL